MGGGKANMSDSTQRALRVASDIIVRRYEQIERALQALQKAQPHELHLYPTGATMRAAELGEWIPIDDVVKAIQILQEGQ
jgi:hypothetical protein